MLRQALDVTRRQLWDLQNRMTGGGSEAKLSCFLLDPEPVFVNVYRAQESIPRNRFRQPM